MHDPRVGEARKRETDQSSMNAPLVTLSDDQKSAENADQVEELQIFIFNRLTPASITMKEFDMEMGLSSADLLHILVMFADKVNAGESLA